MKLLQSSTIFKQRTNHEVNFFPTINSEYIIATLHIVKIEKTEVDISSCTIIPYFN